VRVLLVHPPAGSDMPANYVGESLGLGYLTAVLRRDGHEVQILDAAIQRISGKEAISKILNSDFDCLGITALHEDKDFLVAAARAVKANRKNAIVCAGGYLPSLSTEPLLTECPELDFVIRGEGEHSTREVFRRIAANQNWLDAPGVACRQNGRVVMNAPPPLIDDLDSLPFPARDVLSQARNRDLLFAVASSSRGCYHRCSFCCVHHFYGLSGGKAPRFRSPSNFVDELEHVIATTGVRDFAFISEDFLGPGKAAENGLAIGQEIINRKLDIKFTIEARADSVSEDRINFLKKAGLVGVFMGIESGCQRQLDTYNKAITVEKNKLGIEIVRRCGVEVQPGFIMFDPYVTPDELQENLQFVKETKLYAGRAPLLKCRIYHGVALAEKVRQDGLLIEKGTHLDYEFADPRTRKMWRMVTLVQRMSKLKNKLARTLGRKIDKHYAE